MEYIMLAMLILLLLMIVAMIIFVLWSGNRTVNQYSRSKSFINRGVDVDLGHMINEGSDFIPTDGVGTVYVSGIQSPEVKLYDRNKGIDYGPVSLESPKTFGSMSGRAEIRILYDNYISGMHFKIYLYNGMPYIMDLQSKNGTRLNGEVLKTPVAIKTNDVIQVGATYLYVTVLR